MVLIGTNRPVQDGCTNKSQSAYEGLLLPSGWLSSGDPHGSSGGWRTRGSSGRTRPRPTRTRGQSSTSGSDPASLSSTRTGSPVSCRSSAILPCCLDLGHVLWQQHVSDAQDLILVLADELLHLLHLGRAQLVALGRVLVVLRQLAGHLLPAVGGSLRPGHGTLLRGQQLDVAHRLQRAKYGGTVNVGRENTAWRTKTEAEAIKRVWGGG